jgi:phosphoglycolate phosphatase-like HAD superfamily hydrolase
MDTVIFDIDGTIADIEHRRHFVASKPKNWGAFNRNMIHDTPHSDIIGLMGILWAQGNMILIASGRGEESREVTETWLKHQNIYLNQDDLKRDWRKGNIEYVAAFYEQLYMRKAGDYRADNIVKSEILDQMHADGYDPTMAFDDRDQVVKMWRERGLRCLQVAQGDF